MRLVAVMVEVGVRQAVWLVARASAWWVAVGCGVVRCGVGGAVDFVSVLLAVEDCSSKRATVYVLITTARESKLRARTVQNTTRLTGSNVPTVAGLL